MATPVDVHDHSVDLMEFRNDTTRTRVSTIRHVDPLVESIRVHVEDQVTEKEK